jgi:hypothetical protein
MFGNSHTIVRMALHLEFEQIITFAVGQHLQAIERANNSDTTLTAWFKLNQSDSFANNILYGQIPKFYSWKQDKTEWSKRVAGCSDAEKIIGRIYVASPSEGERYYLRLLLLRVKGEFACNKLK